MTDQSIHQSKPLDIQLNPLSSFTSVYLHNSKLQALLNSGNYIKLIPNQFNKASMSSNGWNTPTFWGWGLRSYNKNWWFRLRCRKVICALDRTIETLTLLLKLKKPYLMTQQQYQMMKKLKTQKQNQPWQQKQTLPN